MTVYEKGDIILVPTATIEKNITHADAFFLPKIELLIIHILGSYHALMEVFSYHAFKNY